MNPRPFAWIAGAILLILGICGYIPPLAPVEMSPLRVSAGVGGPQLFGIFPVSHVLSGLHAALGLWGLLSGSRLSRAVLYARLAGLIFLLLLVMGFVPLTDDLFGLAPLYGSNLMLHFVLALLSFLFGWLYRRHPVEREPDEIDDF